MNPGKIRQVVSVRLRPAELDQVRAAAAAEHSTVGEYMRGVVTRAALLARPGAVQGRTADGAPLVVWTNVADPAAYCWPASK